MAIRVELHQAAERLPDATARLDSSAFRWSAPRLLLDGKTPERKSSHVVNTEGTEYERLQGHFRRVGQLDEVQAIVEWDQAVNMPAGAGQSRAESMANLASLRHELLTQAWLPDVIEKALEEPDLGFWELANVTEMQRACRRARAVPNQLVEESAKADKTSEQAWRRYRAENNFADFAPFLERVVELKREVAQALADALGCSPYDALLDTYEPGASAERIDATFAELKAFLPEFTDQVIEYQRASPAHQPQGPFVVEQQRQLADRMMRATGFEMTSGRLDVSHHPFCGGVPRDVRITTRYDEADFTSSLMGVLHEAGHGKYEQGLPHHWEHQPVGVARGMLIHESQSLLQEMQVCRSQPFLKFAVSHFREAFEEQAAAQPEAFTLENLHRLYTRVERSLIRVDADEVTYPAHVILRYELERDMLRGSLAVKELPDAWDAQMQSLLSLSTSGNDRDGCLQDVHWPCGAFGYFPLYTLGAVAAAQLFERASQELSNLSEQIARGEFDELNSWLGEKVWSRASSVSTEQLLVDATQRPLDPACFIRHLKRRYLGAE